MEERNTHQLEEELKLCPDFTKYYEENRNTMKEDALAVLLQRLLDEKDLKRADVIRNSNLNEVYAYQIFQGKRIPDRTKLLGLVFGMKLNFDEAQQLLRVPATRRSTPSDPSTALSFTAWSRATISWRPTIFCTITERI